MTHPSSDTPAWAVHLGGDLERPDLLRDGSLPGRWTRLWRERSPWRQLQDADGTWLGSDELEERTRTVAWGFLSAGLSGGDRLLLSGPTSAALVIAYIAALRAGLLVVPVNDTYTETEITRIVRGARPSGAVVAREELGRWVAAAAEAVAIWDLSALPASPGSDEEIAIDRAQRDDPAVLIYTSGTTGQAKGVPLSHGNLLASATAVGLAWRWQPDDTLLLTLPLFHVHGLGVGINGTLCAGASAALRRRFDPADVAARCGEGGISMFFGVPTMYQRLVRSGEASALRRLRVLVSGSAPLPAALAHELSDQAGQLPVERYGMTETVMLTSNPYEGLRKPGTVGLALPQVELRLADDDEVQVSGPNVIAGYWERPDADAAAFTADGWFRTGDLGRFDEDGYLILAGRSNELIITGGYNVYPREVEEVLMGFPGVREVAVVGRPSDRWGEEVTAVVVAAQELDTEALRAHAANQLAPYKVPKRVELTDELPRNALGKVVRSEL